MNAKETKKAEIDKQIAETDQKLKEAQTKEEQNEYVQRQIDDYKKAIEILNEEKKSIIESQEENVELQKQQLIDSAQLFVTKKTSDAIPVFENVPKWVSSFFKFGKLPVYLFQAMTKGKATLLPFIEGVDSEASSEVAKDLRKTMYSIMNLKRVEEMYRTGVEMNTEVLEIEAPKVVLANSVKLSVEERKHLVL